MLPQHPSPELVMDTTALRPRPHTPIDRTHSLPAPDNTAKSGSVFRLTSLLRPIQDTLSIGRITSASDPTGIGEGFTHIMKRASSSFIPITTSPKRDGSPLPSPESQNTLTASTKSITPTPTRAVDHTYPPSTPPSDSHLFSIYPSSSSWSVGVPSWLKVPSRRVFNNSSAGASIQTVTGPTGVSEVYSSTASSGNRLSGTGDLGYSVLESPETTVDAEVTEKFYTSFAFDEKETLLGCTWCLHLMARSMISHLATADFPGYIFRLLPVFGRLYISTNYFCFRSSGPLVSKTWVCSRLATRTTRSLTPLYR
jgi:sterol 3beta-glucosyltransferase